MDPAKDLPRYPAVEPKDALATFLYLLGGGPRPSGRPERPAEPLRDMNLWFRLLYLLISTPFRPKLAAPHGASLHRFLRRRDAAVAAFARHALVPRRRLGRTRRRAGAWRRN